MVIIYINIENRILFTYLSNNCTPLMEATPMYKKTPKSTAMGINRRSGAISTDSPIIRHTKNPDKRCSLTSTILGDSPGAWVLFNKIF